MVADDLNTCKPAVGRQICIARVKKGAQKRLDKIEGWDRGKARIWRRLTELPFDGDLHLPRLARAVRDGDATLRRMRVELVGKWRAPLCRRRRGDVPWTNNAAERAIGRIKIRRKTVRGYKSEDRTLNGFGHGRSGRLGDVGAGRGATPRRRLGGAAPSETRPKMTNRFWDGYLLAVLLVRRVTPDPSGFIVYISPDANAMRHSLGDQDGVNPLARRRAPPDPAVFIACIA